MGRIGIQGNIPKIYTDIRSTVWFSSKYRGIIIFEAIGFNQKQTFHKILMTKINADFGVNGVVGNGNLIFRHSRFRSESTSLLQETNGTVANRCPFVVTKPLATRLDIT